MLRSSSKTLRQLTYLRAATSQQRSCASLAWHCDIRNDWMMWKGHKNCCRSWWCFFSFCVVGWGIKEIGERPSSFFWFFHQSLIIRYSAASNEGLQNGTQSSLPGEETLGWKSQDHWRFKSYHSYNTKLYKKPMTSDDCDDICGHYWGDKLMDTLQVDGLKRHQIPSFFPSDPQVWFRFPAFKIHTCGMSPHIGAIRSCTCQKRFISIPVSIHRVLFE